MSIVIDTEKHLEYQDIKELYTSGNKNKQDFKVGLEYERLPIRLSDYKAAEYDGNLGICNFLRTFARNENWDYITDDLNIIGLKQGHDTITLEPGCQLEFSLEPQTSINNIEKKVKTLDKFIKPILDKFGIRLLNYGVSPLSTNKTIKLIPKKRYHIMAKYLWGILSDVMMRETAGIQGTFDFKDEQDAIRKYKIANMLSPFMTAMFANSPIRGGVDTGYKSFRALSWLNTDNDRCGFTYNFDNDYSFDDYINYVMETPMLFIDRDNETVKINGKINFKEFMLSGYNGYMPELEDYLLQANLCFPEVRLRNFIEIRNHDCCGGDAPYSILAIYKAILYNETAMNDIEDLFRDLKFKDLCELRYNVPKTALATEFKKYQVKDFAQEILYIAEKSLIEENSGEEKYLEYIKEFVLKGYSPADIIIRNWNGCWNKDINKLINFIS